MKMKWFESATSVSGTGVGVVVGDNTFLAVVCLRNRDWEKKNLIVHLKKKKKSNNIWKDKKKIKIGNLTG